MKREIAGFVFRCLLCPQIKVEHQKSYCTLNQLDISVWKWADIIIDFIFGLPWTFKGHNKIWAIADIFTKLTHFLLMSTITQMDKLAKLHIDEISFPRFGKVCMRRSVQR